MFTLDFFILSISPLLLQSFLLDLLMSHPTTWHITFPPFVDSPLMGHLFSILFRNSASDSYMELLSRNILEETSILWGPPNHSSWQIKRVPYKFAHEKLSSNNCQDHKSRETAGKHHDECNRKLFPWIWLAGLLCRHWTVGCQVKKGK